MDTRVMICQMAETNAQKQYRHLQRICNGLSPIRSKSEKGVGHSCTLLILRKDKHMVIHMKEVTRTPALASKALASSRTYTKRPSTINPVWMPRRIPRWMTL